MEIIISLLALLSAFYQAHLQRTHNKKSLKPLGQINFLDKNGQLSIYLTNNGMGPMIIDRLTIIKEGVHYNDIKKCLDLNPKSYRHVSISDVAKKVILPNANVVVFEKNFKDPDIETQMETVRAQLSMIIVKVDSRDIYDGKFIFERSCEWFSRHVVL